MSLMIAFGVIAIMGNIPVCAATFDDLNQPDIFFKQTPGQDGCVVSSCAMMIRRTLIGTGNSNWASVTESSLKGTACVSGTWRVKYTFSCMGVDVKHSTFNNSSATLQNLLASHPEGIVLFSTNVGHGVLVTDYTDGQFYAADPAPGYPSGRILLSQVQKVTISNATEYWYVSSPKVTLTTVQVPTPEIHDDKNIVTINENLTFTYSGLSICSKVEFCFVRSGENEPYYSVDSTSSREFTTYFENAGTYEVYVRGYYNGSWYNSSKIKVSVLNAKLVADKASVKTGETINFEYSGLTYASKVEIVFCDKDENPYWTEDITSSRTYSNFFENEGMYKVYAQYVYDGNLGKTNTVTVFALNPQISTNKNNVGVSEELELSYSGLTMANAVYYYIYNQKGDLYSSIESTQNRTLTIHFTEADSYQICAVGYTNDRAFESNYLSIFVHENSFQITYNANGGFNPPAKQQKTYGVPLMLSSVIPERSGYYFLGWSESSSAASPTYSAGGNFSKDASTTLYAVWQPNAYTVTLDPDGGTCGIPAITAYYNEIYGTLPEPTRDGFAFDGWFLADGTLVTESKVCTMTADHTLTAHWTAVETSGTLTAKADSGAVVDRERGFVYGLAFGVTEAALREQYLEAADGAHIEIERVSAAIGTGTVLHLVDDTTGDELESFTVVIFGDVTGDGLLNSSDVTEIRSVNAGIITYEADSAQFFAADVTRDGNVNPSDVTEFRNANAGISDVSQTI